ncbi:hypothetical protein FOL46_001495 [Perkinsus olseni]|uniref:Uncharacterized protein n=1 Tax=Perkinsus olseni TaxID=32597 RepID=A0A7J6KTA4_PEROL|nr:hypothetical protein FOL46_001495 [Perkinsus olseni]
MFALVLLTSVYGASAQRFFGSASFPEGCTGARKPASESFCITAAVRLVQDGGADITMFIFGDDDPTKSTNYRMEYTPLSSRPNFRATGGGSAKAVQVGFPGILGASVTLSTETSGDGGATFYPHTRKETANTGMTIDAEVCALGTCFDLASSSTNITADAGPDLAAGMEANFKASTGNSNCGVSIDYDLKMKIRDRNIFTWLMTGEGKLSFWFAPFINLTRPIYVFQKELDVQQ